MQLACLGAEVVNKLIQEQASIASVIVGVGTCCEHISKLSWGERDEIAISWLIAIPVSVWCQSG